MACPYAKKGGAWDPSGSIHCLSYFRKLMNWSEVTKLTSKRILFAVLIILIAAISRLWPLQALGTKVVWLTFYPAVMIISLYSGIGGGIIATALTCIIVVYFWQIIVPEPFIVVSSDWLSMAVFISTCIMISFVSEAMRQSKDRIIILQEKAQVAHKEIANHAQKLSNQAKLLELAHDYILVRDRDSAIIFWNSSAERGYGWTKHEALMKNKYEFLKPQFPISFKETQDKLLADGYWEGDLIHTKKDGAEISVESRQSVIKDEHDEVVAFLEINRDITERKRMENSLKENEERFRTCFDNMLDCIHIYKAVRDESGSITDFLMDYSNEAACLARKMTKEELYGRSYLELFHNYVKKELFHEYCKVIETGEPLIRYEDSYHNELHTHISGVYDYKVFKFEDGLVMSWRDITEQKKLEQEIIRLDKLNLVGEMAAGIGHEVRNPMTTVRGFLQLLSTKEDCSQYIDYYTLMIEELDRANSIITEFLSVAKDRVITLEMQSLKKIVENILPLIQSDATISDKYIHAELEEVQEIPLDKKEINQLVINLARNGLEAMSPGGNLKIKTFVEKKAIVLSVQNNGPEIPQEVLKKIGTPFFTTKDNGTGLGLAVCFSIAARHNAKIDIETGSTGTTFSVRFKS